jgi:hypothetical protein
MWEGPLLDEAQGKVRVKTAMERKPGKQADRQVKIGRLPVAR